MKRKSTEPYQLGEKNSSQQFVTYQVYQKMEKTNKKSANTCKHGLVQKECKTCRYFCQHIRRRDICKVCIAEKTKEKQLELLNPCKHGRVERKCDNCKRYCQHGTRKDLCKPCKGRLLCEHEIRRSQCVPCGGGSICEHKKQRRACVACNGNGICEHKLQIATCRECGGSSFCIHDKRKYQCRDCHGSGVCEHNVRRTLCGKCHGNWLCIHNKQRQSCKDCYSVKKMIESKRWCVGCTNKKLSPQRIRAEIKICAECDPRMPARIEHVVMNMFDSMIGFPASATDNIMIGGKECDTKKRRPDACWISPDGRIAFLEIDESGHVDRDTSCEIAKVTHQTESVHHAYPGFTVVHFRFNPSEFDHKGVHLKTRVKKTAYDICLFLSGVGDDWQCEVPYVLYYYYPKKAHFHIEHAFNKASDAIRILVVDNEIFRLATDLHDVCATWTNIS